MRPTLDHVWSAVSGASPTVHASFIALFAVLATTLVVSRAARRGTANALAIVRDQQKYDSEQRRQALVEDRIRRARDTALARELRLEDLAELRAQRLLDQRLEAARAFSAALQELDDVATPRELAPRRRELAPHVAAVRLLFGRDSGPAACAERCLADAGLVASASRTTADARRDAARAALRRAHAAFDAAALAFLEGRGDLDAEPARDVPLPPSARIRTPA
jgi:hypothetical protein